MEATPNGFCIREYTSNMRSVNIFKCWPFPIGNLTREEIESQLPEMITSNTSKGYKTNNPHSGAFGSANQRESVESERSFSGVDAMEAPLMKEEQRHIRRLKRKASRRRTLTEIFNLNMVGEEKLSSKKQASPSPLVPPLLESLLLPEQRCQPQIENNLEVLALDVDKYENQSKSKINCGIQAQGFSEEQQPIMSPSFSSKPKPRKMGSFAKISKNLDAVCENKHPMKENEVNEEAFHKSYCSKNKIDMKKVVAKKRMIKVAFKMGRRWIPPLNYKSEKNSVLINAKNHSIKKSEEEFQKSSCSNIAKIKSKRSERKDVGKKNEDKLLMKVGKHWVLPQNKKMSKKNISFKEGIIEREGV